MARWAGIEDKCWWVGVPALIARGASWAYFVGMHICQASGDIVTVVARRAVSADRGSSILGYTGKGGYSCVNPYQTMYLSSIKSTI